MPQKEVSQILKKEQRTKATELELLYNLDVGWFQSAGAEAPEEKATEYQNWLKENKPRSPNTLIKKSMSLATGKSESAIGFYLSKTKNQINKLSEETLDILDGIYKTLGREPRERESTSKSKLSSPRRIIIFTELADADIPSPIYHLKIIQAIIKSAKGDKNIHCSLYEANQNSLDQKMISTVLREYHPDGVVFIRIDPSEDILRILKNKKKPVVLIHSDGNHYSAPILANIIPKQNAIPKLVGMLSRNFKELPSTDKESIKSNKVVVVHMDQGEGNTIRSERIELIKKGIELGGCIFKPFAVENYRFYQAYKVYEEYKDNPEVIGYFCLSDEIAVALKQLMLAGDKKAPEDRIIGFDGLETAKNENINSFSQNFHEIGEKVIKRFATGMSKMNKRERISLLKMINRILMNLIMIKTRGWLTLILPITQCNDGPENSLSLFSGPSGPNSKKCCGMVSLFRLPFRTQITVGQRWPSSYLRITGF